MKIKLVLFLTLYAFTSLYAQHHESCGTSKLHKAKMLEDPVYAEKMNAFNRESSGNIPKNTQADYIIPVVVHVMHKGEPLGVGTNISDDVIKKHIKSINERFRKIPAQWTNEESEDTKIEFALAVRDPQGNCTNGINRINLSSNADYMNHGVQFESQQGITEANLKAISFWNSTQYYNIWIVSEIDGTISITQGYAYFAAAHGQNFDGTVILSTSFSTPDSSTSAHELGHALNLYHSFEGDEGGTNCPDANGCGDGFGDCCSDTPSHVRFENCLTNSVNPCNTSNTDLSYRKNFMNYSDIATCTNMFTPNQKSRMIAAISGLRASLLAANGNMSLVPPSSPDADFEVASGQIACQGSDIMLTDKSRCIPNTFLANTSWPEVSHVWTVYNPQNTYTFNTQNPVFTIPVPGVYNVSLTATNAFGTDSVTKFNTLLVPENEAAAIPPCVPEITTVGNYFNTVCRVALNSINNSSSVIMGGYKNYSCISNTVLVTGEIYEMSVTLNSGNNSTQNVIAVIDFNNDGIFNVLEEPSEIIFFASNPPNSQDTYTANIQIPENAVLNKMLTMRIVGGSINPFAINCSEPFEDGDIEDYGVYIVNEPISGMEENKTNKITLSPNPVESSFTLNGDMEIDGIKIYNMLGQLVLEKTINASQSIVDISNLRAGAYIVQAAAQNKTTILKILKK